MAIGKTSDFIIYEEQFYAGLMERITQNTVAFNAASNGGLTLVARALKGHYEQQAFMDDLSGLITRRDITSVSAATDLAMTMDELISVKVNRKIGPATQTMDAFRKLGVNRQEQSFKLGQMVADHKTRDYLNAALRSLNAALLNTAALLHDGTAGTLTHAGLVTILSKKGDRADSIVAWVMHSKQFFDLMQQSLTDKIDSVAGVTIHQGSVATLGRPVIVTDSADLIDTVPTPDEYSVIGLVAGSCTITESEAQEIVVEPVTGLENLAVRIQGEFAYNIEVKGFKWDTANGGINPTDAALATGSNWDAAMVSVQNLAGAIGQFQ